MPDGWWRTHRHVLRRTGWLLCPLNAQAIAPLPIPEGDGARVGAVRHWAFRDTVPGHAAVSSSRPSGVHALEVPAGEVSISELPP